MKKQEQEIQKDVQRALREDIGHGDATSALVPEAATCCAEVISREAAILCGCPWFDEVFHQLDLRVEINWSAQDGDSIAVNQKLCTITGPARALLGGERSALNFLQTLSGTATVARRYADRVADLPVEILDTRKTLPGLRLAQKYATRTGGCRNHRLGLYDGILIKENHIFACGSISAAIDRAKLYNKKNLPIEVEVENLSELHEALEAGADMLLLDNFTTTQLRAAANANSGRAQLEASGNVTLETVREIAESGVDFISVGALTKDLRAIDLSMRFS
ncbi:MAG: carboxylating nicotinate-nucleotide diphosphorylase [Gammaproteobacteria bacterium]|nr:carboxylating nicotinate-nucleotide diphosphorylase [Gammaproteobacteria bacterium]